ncbi:PEGA domain-containing protein [Treponema pectinovorum]|uniref:PEGA domain-containing protein n=1 Tax=Treponema pectinovorum TaxID=164 RepID=UPI0011C950C0|nr:PEGA domain-containing protein [Treponema pectinovorum]
MTKKKFGATVISSLMLFVMFASCVTSTRVQFNTDVEGATLYIDGEKIGTTPTQVKLSNGIWNDPDIILKKEGYQDLRTDLAKEVKGVNLVAGLLIWWPSLLWVYGPKKTQNYMLFPENKSNSIVNDQK